MTLASIALLLSPQITADLFSASDQLIADAGPFGGLIIIALAVLHSVIFFPMELLAIASGLAFGFWLGTFYMWLGSMLAACLCFALSRRLGRPFVIRFMKPAQVAKLDTWVDSAGVTTLLVGRLLPIVSFNLVNYGAGLTKVSWFTYLWTTAVGILPILSLSVLFGSMMSELPWPLVLGISGGAIISIIGVHVWRRRAR